MVKKVGVFEISKCDLCGGRMLVKEGGRSGAYWCSRKACRKNRPGVFRRTE